MNEEVFSLFAVKESKSQYNFLFIAIQVYLRCAALSNEFLECLLSKDFI